MTLQGSGGDIWAPDTRRPVARRRSVGNPERGQASTLGSVSQFESGLTRAALRFVAVVGSRQT